jgi:peptidoglycan-N-acetylglucosamine deacetylase
MPLNKSMPRQSSPAWWRVILYVLNAGLPLPALILLGMAHPLAWLFFAFTLAMHGLLLWGIMHPRCNWLGPLTHSFRPEGKEVWLTVDDGPDGDRTRELSNQLKARGVRATFFVIGERLSAHSEMAHRLLADGHTLANHTQRHPRKSFWCSSPSRVRAEVDDGAAQLQAPGLEPKWFRPPVGHKPPALRGILAERRMRLISWTVGGRDGWSADVGPVVERVLAKTKPGAIIVLHEARAYSIPTILAVVDALLARGFVFTIPTEDMLGDTTREVACDPLTQSRPGISGAP